MAKIQITNVDQILKLLKIEYITEYKFCPTRKYRFDFYIPSYNIGIEIEGGTWINGRHSRGKGYASDCQKYNLAACLGIFVLRFTYDMLKNNEFYNTLMFFKNKC